MKTQKFSKIVSTISICAAALFTMQASASTALQCSVVNIGSQCVTPVTVVAPGVTYRAVIDVTPQTSVNYQVYKNGAVVWQGRAYSDIAQSFPHITKDLAPRYVYGKLSNFQRAPLSFPIIGIQPSAKIMIIN